MHLGAVQDIFSNNITTLTGPAKHKMLRPGVTHVQCVQSGRLVITSNELT